MYNHDDLLLTIKEVAKNTMNADKPSSLCYGTVKSVEPLSVAVDQKLILDEDNLILTNCVRDYDTFISVDTVTENADGHSHKMKKEKLKIKVHNKPEIGDTLALLKVHGGQDYIVISKEV